MKWYGSTQVRVIVVYSDDVVLLLLRHIPT